jgi:hypothetical protein
MVTGQLQVIQQAATINISDKKALYIRVRPFNFRYTSPPIPLWYDTIAISCTGLATGYRACIDSRETAGTVGNKVALSVNCPSCTVIARYDSYSCWRAGANQEVNDFVEGVSGSGRDITVSATATRGSGNCQGRVSFLISDGVNSTTAVEDVSLGWTVN